MDIKDVIRLDIFPMVTFTPYYDTSPPLWEILTNSMSSFCHIINSQKGYIYLAVRILLPDDSILGGTPGLCVIQKL